MTTARIDALELPLKLSLGSFVQLDRLAEVLPTHHQQVLSPSQVLFVFPSDERSCLGAGALEGSYRRGVGANVANVSFFTPAIQKLANTLQPALSAHTQGMCACCTRSAYARLGCTG